MGLPEEQLQYRFQANIQTSKIVAIANLDQPLLAPKECRPHKFRASSLLT
jgi:hypothetical protein